MLDKQSLFINTPACTSIKFVQFEKSMKQKIMDYCSISDQFEIAFSQHHFNKINRNVAVYKKTTSRIRHLGPF